MHGGDAEDHVMEVTRVCEVCDNEPDDEIMSDHAMGGTAETH